MKINLIPLALAGTVLCCAQSPAQKLESKEHLSKTFTVKNTPATTVAVYNLNGPMKVEGYDGDKVIIEVDKTITGKTEGDVTMGKSEFRVEFEQVADSVIAYIAAPFDSRPNRGKNRNWNRDKIPYDFHCNFVVKVPHGVSLDVSTVNGGDMDVSNVTGKMSVHNVNGAIKVTNAKGAAKIGTVNGAVEANFLAVPPGESVFRTINGNITVTYPPALSVDCHFKSMHGEFFTDFPDVQPLPVRVTKNEEKRDQKTIFKLDTETMIRIGKGGPTYKFETLNGNIYLKKQS